MSTEPTTWPHIQAQLNPNGTGELTIGGIIHPIAAATLEQAREETITIVATRAQQLGRPLAADMYDPAGHWPLIIHPDGTTEAPQAPATALKTTTRNHAPGSLPDRDDDQRPDDEPLTPTDVKAAHTQPQRQYTSEQSYPKRRELRESFLTKEQTEEPAHTGWRGYLNRVGVRITPSSKERAQRADIHTVSQHWPGPRTIAIVNGKGGAGKTPTTVLLAAVFARYGGAGVLTWDNNQTRGTLGWRTEQGPHHSTVLELLPHIPELLSTQAQSADLARYVHHQTHDRFDVLRSQPMELASAQRVNATDVDAIHQLASKYYRLILIDSGNDESDPMWQRMIDHTDQLVVATTTRDDHAEAGALLLEALTDRDEHSAALAQQAIVIVNQADPKAHATDLNRVANGYRPLARKAITIPHDPAMVDGILRYRSLKPTTQRAWLSAAAAVAQGL